MKNIEDFKRDLYTEKMTKSWALFARGKEAHSDEERRMLIAAFARQQGYDITEEDLRRDKQGDRPLSDEELDEVTGGLFGDGFPTAADIESELKS